MNYFEYTFTLNPLLPAREILVVELAELGFESFVESDQGLLAYIREADHTEGMTTHISILTWPDQTVECQSVLIPDQNWNAEWEKNFEPIEVDRLCRVRAPFHQPDGQFTLELVIEPRMSFGTGHHATTWMMMRSLFDLDLKGAKVLDMGSGTGVLAILAEKRGAASVLAIDCDEWADENARENVARNGCKVITCQLGDASLLGGEQFNVVLANINRNILTRDAQAYLQVTADEGDILLSGFYTQDIPAVIEAFPGCELVADKERNSWALLHLKKLGV
jgi:ribosomal protein L11 methyltransferase